MTININLKNSRFMKNMKAWQLAQKASISPQCLSLIELGRLMPSPEIKQRIAKALGRKVEDLF